MPVQTWDPKEYEKNARFVSQLGGAVLDLLAPKAGERILDIGCGDGILTEKIAALGAKVVGVDSSEAMIQAAVSRGLDARLADAQSLLYDSEFDAVFSNAALHWMPDPDAVIDGVFRALKPGGRFVAEFGGHGNIAAIRVAELAVCAKYGGDPQSVSGKYYPRPDEYGSKLSARGLVVDSIHLFPRPTRLPTGMEGWLETFGKSFLESFAQESRAAAKRETIELLRPVLCDSEGDWTADYVRLRLASHRPS